MATTGGQTINDRLNAVRYALVGQGLARTVCKATTEEVLGPKKKHIDYLIACTNEPNVSIPQMANLLIERSQHSSWAVVFKSLTTIHHLMSFGNERFTQYLATSNHSFELNDFMDRQTPQGYNMSTFVRNYSKYVNDKTISYRLLALDLCKIKSGNDNALRTMNMDNLSKTLPIVHKQFDSLLEFNADVKDLNNGVIMAAFRLLYKDLVRLYVAYQEAIINLLERYFKLSRKKTREALEMYKKYLNRMDKVEEFLKVVDQVGLDKSEMPDLTKSPASILKLLEKHLMGLEAKKRGATPTSGNKSNNDDDDQDDDQDQSSSSKQIAQQQDSKQAPPETGPAQAASTEGEPTTKHQEGQQTSGGSGDQVKNQPPVVIQKQPPPQKPARPSPKASPKASAPQEQKKAPPERPTKPPSRPPPPAASSGEPSTSKARASPTGVAGSRPSKDESTGSKPVPPPHPPPPTHLHSPQSPRRSVHEPEAIQATSPAKSEPIERLTPEDVAKVDELTQANNVEADEKATALNEIEISSSESEVAGAENISKNDEAGEQEEDLNQPQQDEEDHKLTCTTQMSIPNSGGRLDEANRNHETNHVHGSQTNLENNCQNHELEPQAEIEMPPPPPPIGEGVGEEEEVPVAEIAAENSAQAEINECQEANEVSGEQLVSNGLHQNHENNDALDAPESNH